MTEGLVTQTQYKEIDDYIEALTTHQGALIPVLHKAQKVVGYLPEELQQHVALKLGIPTAKVFGVVSFYSFFKEKKEGQFNVNVCLGTACFVRSSDKVVEELEKQLKVKVGETTPDGMFTLGSIRCVGACGLAPVVMVNDKVYGRVKPSDVSGIIDDCMAKGVAANE